ncbi:hypothetical protein ACSBR2_011908 [Camellia fascicularis]
MNFFDMDNMTYMHALTNFPAQNNILSQESYYYTMLITNKGVNAEYEKILNIFIAINFSSNKFKGKIPKSIGNLKGLQLLNLSNNDLSEGITSCLGNLINLESLDLSQNKLSRKIPQQLALLTFLEFLNLSNNHLIGPIPNGKQFNTFENNSYEGNFGLCGDLLSRKCGKSKAPLPSPPLNSEQDNESTFRSTVDWIVICMGYVSGIVVGMVIGHTITTRYPQPICKILNYLLIITFFSDSATLLSFLYSDSWLKNTTPPSLSLDDLSSTPPTREQNLILLERLLQTRIFADLELKMVYQEDSGVEKPNSVSRLGGENMYAFSFNKEDGQRILEQVP